MKQIQGIKLLAVMGVFGLIFFGKNYAFSQPENQTIFHGNGHSEAQADTTELELDDLASATAEFTKPFFIPKNQSSVCISNGKIKKCSEVEVPFCQLDTKIVSKQVREINPKKAPVVVQNGNVSALTSKGYETYWTSSYPSYSEENYERRPSFSLGTPSVKKVRKENHVTISIDQDPTFARINCVFPESKTNPSVSEIQDILGGVISITIASVPSE